MYLVVFRKFQHVDYGGGYTVVLSAKVFDSKQEAKKALYQEDNTEHLVFGWDGKETSPVDPVEFWKD